MLMPTPAALLNLTRKLEKHLSHGDCQRVKDYLMCVGVFCPDIAKVDFIDRELLDRCLDLLHTAGWTVETNSENGLVLYAPGVAGFYRTHRNGVPKEQILNDVPHIRSMAS